MDCFLMSKKRKGFEHSFKFKKNKFDLAKKIYDEVEILLKILFKQILEIKLRFGGVSLNTDKIRIYEITKKNWQEQQNCY